MTLKFGNNNNPHFLSSGINRHFQMVSIHERLSSGIKKLSSQDVWDHLSTLYDLRALVRESFFTDLLTRFRW